LVVGCSADDDGEGSGNCGKLAENYYSYGECLPSGGCTVAQNGCKFTLDCEDGTMFVGEISGSSVEFEDDETLCSGELVSSNKGLLLTCYGAPGTAECEFQFECEDGGACSSGS
jgi:hypothetical protein